MAKGEENKEAVREFFARATEGDFDGLGAVVSPDYVLHDPSMPEEVRGIEGIRALVESYHEGFGGGHRVTIEQQLADGDYVATRYTCRGTHSGDIMGVPATGREVTFEALAISRFQDGKVVEEWVISDTLGLLQQLGGLPEMVEG